jgi:hypothetical protein
MPVLPALPVVRQQDLQTVKLRRLWQPVLVLGPELAQLSVLLVRRELWALELVLERLRVLGSRERRAQLRVQEQVLALVRPERLVRERALRELELRLVQWGPEPPERVRLALAWALLQVRQVQGQVLAREPA